MSYSLFGVESPFFYKLLLMFPSPPSPFIPISVKNWEGVLLYMALTTTFTFLMSLHSLVRRDGCRKTNLATTETLVAKGIPVNTNSVWLYPHKLEASGREWHAWLPKKWLYSRWHSPISPRRSKEKSDLEVSRNIVVRNFDMMAICAELSGR